MMLVELVLGMVMVKVMMDPSMVVSTLGHTMMLVLLSNGLVLRMVDSTARPVVSWEGFFWSWKLTKF